MRPRLALAVLVLVATAIPAGTAIAAAPANNDFATPATLTSEAGPLLGDNLDATSEPSETSYTASKWNDCGAFDARPDCGGSVWYAFTAPATANYTIETCDKGTEVDTVLIAFNGTALGGLGQLASNDDDCDGGYGGNGSRITFPATAGTTYPIQLTGFVGQQGTFYIRAYPAASPPAAPPIDTRITRYQSVVSDAPYNSQDGTHSGVRRTATFAFVSTAADATYACSLDGDAFAACTSPASYDTLPVDGAQHTFTVRSTSGATTDSTPSVQRFRLDETAPETSILSGPAEGATVPGPVQFSRATTERSINFLTRCTLDGVGPYACSSSTLNIAALCDGSHTFGMQSLDEAGNLDATPAQRTFSISGGGTCFGPALGAANTGTPNATTATITVPVSAGGVPANATFRYGPSTAYGETIRQVVLPDATTVGTTLNGLLPGTLYHYVVTARDGAGGTSTTSDQTFTTAPLPGGAAVPTVTLGTPVIAGRHAVRLPLTLTAGASPGFAGLRVFVDKGPVSFDSPSVAADDELPYTTLPAATAVDVVDLEPATTYRYRVLVSSSESYLSPEGTFTTAAVPTPAPPVAGGPTPPPAAPAAAPFRLKAGNVSVGKLSRSAKRLTVKVKGVPKRTKLGLKIKGAKVLATAKATASNAGTATFKVKLGAKARKALKSKGLKRVRFTVTATPPGGKATAVTVTKRLR